MIKRTIFYTLFVAILTTGLYFSFKYFQPKVQKTDYLTNNINYSITKNDLYNLSDFNNYLMTNSPENINVIFYQENDINSQYLFDNILPQLYENYSIDSLDKVIYVTLEDNDYKNKPAFNSTYGFSNVPALVNLTYKNGNIIINNILSDNDNQLVNYETVENWLLLNEIIISNQE